MSGSTLLSLVDVGLSYPRSRSLFKKQSMQVLKGVNFEIKAGETVGVVGRNGAGKSSLLRLMAGVLQPDEGQVIKHQPQLRVALLAMQLGFQTQLTGRENAIMGCLIMGLSRTEANALLPDIISFSGLGVAIDEPVNNYSSGMRARLGFSVAYHTRAEVMLIDEVLGVGDHEFKLKSRDALLSAIVSDRTVVIVSHDEYFLSEMCDSLVWLEHGHFIMHGSPQEVLAAYHDYDHIVLQLAEGMGTEVQEVRTHPFAADPIALIKRMRRELRQKREAALPASMQRASHAAVNYIHPGNRETLSSLCTQECGSTAWVENTALIACGKDSEVRPLFLAYEDAIFAIAQAGKIEPHAIRQTHLNRKLVDVMDQLARLNDRS